MGVQVFLLLHFIAGKKDKNTCNQMAHKLLLFNVGRRKLDPTAPCMRSTFANSVHEGEGQQMKISSMWLGVMPKPRRKTPCSQARCAHASHQRAKEQLDGERGFHRKKTCKQDSQCHDESYQLDPLRQPYIKQDQ